MDEQDKLVQAEIDAMSKPVKHKYFVDDDGWICIDSNECSVAEILFIEHVEPLTKILDSHDVLLKACKDALDAATAHLDTYAASEKKQYRPLIRLRGIRLI